MQIDKESINQIQKDITGLVTAKFPDYYLTAGTALLIQYNHRLSEDLDFFTQEYKQELPQKIMEYVGEKTGFKFNLESQQNDPKLVPMQIYMLELQKEHYLKIDFVQDFYENLNPIKNGIHSIADIYFRKIYIGAGASKDDSTGKTISLGRQAAKDIFDIFYLSQHYMPLSKFFFEYFSYDKAAAFIIWYRSFNRLDLKTDLYGIVPAADSQAVLKYLDKEILENMADKLL